jgi:hypothetical protein
MNSKSLLTSLLMLGGFTLLVPAFLLAGLSFPYQGQAVAGTISGDTGFGSFLLSFKNYNNLLVISVVVGLLGFGIVVAALIQARKNLQQISESKDIHPQKRILLSTFILLMLTIGAIFIGYTVGTSMQARKKQVDNEFKVKVNRVYKLLITNGGSVGQFTLCKLAQTDSLFVYLRIHKQMCASLVDLDKLPKNDADFQPTQIGFLKNAFEQSANLMRLNNLKADAVVVGQILP